MTCSRYILASILILLSVASCKKEDADFEKNIVPVAEAGSSKSVILPDSAVVTGSGTDADGKVVAYSWSQVSGPTNSTIVNPGAASTVIKFTVPGNYVFQLMVTDDNGAPGVDTVAIAVSGSNPSIEGNKAPIANAGPSQTITSPIIPVFTGTGTDVDGKIVAYLWSLVSGPANPTIANPGSPSTKIHYGPEGTYVFQLMVVDDKGAIGVDTTTLVVKPVITNTLTLQPANNPYEFNVAVEDGVDMSGIPTYDLPVQTWNRNGKLYTVRTLIKFDLSSIPANANILSANLYLYSYPSPTVSGDGINANYNSFNYSNLLVQQVTSNWSTSTASWSNQPSTTSAGQVIDNNANPNGAWDLNLPVELMVKSMVNNNANYGFLLKLEIESPYNNSRIFVSSHNPNPSFAAKFPKLVIVYR